MKNLVLLLIVASVLSACVDKKEKQKAILDDIIKVHDRVMASDDQLMKNKTLLDSLVKSGSPANRTDSIHLILNKVNLTDSVMGNWMHKFDPEQTGKTDDEKLTYFTGEKTKIMSIDSQMNAVIKQSNIYLNKNKTK